MTLSSEATCRDGRGPGVVLHQPRLRVRAEQFRPPAAENLEHPDADMEAMFGDALNEEY